MLRKAAPFFAVLLACAGIFCLAQAQVPVTGAGLGVPYTSGGSSPTWTGTAASLDTSCGFVTTCTITGLTVTTGFAVASIYLNNGGTDGTISTVALCGTNLTLIEDSGAGGSSSHQSALWGGTITGGTCSAALTASTTNAIQVFGIAYGTLNNLNSTTAGTTCGTYYSGGTNTPYACGASLTVSSGGFAIAGIGISLNGAISSSNMTMDATAVGASNSGVGIGHSTASSVNPSIAGTGFADAGVEGASYR